MAPLHYSLLGFLAVGLWLVGCSGGSADDRPLHRGPVHRGSAPSTIAGDAGAGSVQSISCEDAPLEGREGSCAPTDPGNACQLCVERQCCAEQSACNALVPDESCAFGSTLYQGKPLVGEITCMMECFASRRAQGSFHGNEADMDECAAHCAASECDRPTVGPTTRHLAECIVGASRTADHCQSECGLRP